MAHSVLDRAAGAAIRAIRGKFNKKSLQLVYIIATSSPIALHFGQYNAHSLSS